MPSSTPSGRLRRRHPGRRRGGFVLRHQCPRRIVCQSLCLGSGPSTAPYYSCRVSDPSSPETSVALTRRARKIYRTLVGRYPQAKCELDFENPLQLLVATVMSAQTTDVRVNLVTPAVFSRYRSAADYASADRVELETMIQSTGFYRAKTDSLIKLGTALVERFGGEVPPRLGDLVTVPGVGRKTANVVLGNAFGIPGITVDTHFGRLARRLGWTTEDDPVKVERAVGALFPKKDWTMLSHVLICLL